MVEKNESKGTQDTKMALTLEVNGKSNTVKGEGVIAAVNVGVSDEHEATAILIGGVLSEKTVVNMFRKVIDTVGLPNAMSALSMALQKPGIEVEEML